MLVNAEGYPIGVSVKECLYDLVTGQGYPAPVPGGAVSVGKEGGGFYSYRANAVVRPNPVGVLHPTLNEIISSGICTGLDGVVTTPFLASGTEYFLECFPNDYYSLGYSDTINKWCAIRTSTQWSQAQSFKGVGGGFIFRATVPLKATGSPTGYVYLQVMEDSGGLPNGNVLCESEHIAASEVTGVGYDVVFRFFNSFIMEDKTYHLVVCRSSYQYDDSNYVEVGCNDSGTYGDGNRSYQTASGGVWIGDSTDDLIFMLYYSKPDYSVSNITDVHPWDVVDLADVAVYKPVTRIGRAVNSMAINVNIETVMPRVLLTYDTPITETSNDFVLHPVGMIDAFGCSRICVLYKLALNNSSWSRRWYRSAFFGGDAVATRQPLYFRMRYYAGPPAVGFAGAIFAGMEEEPESVQEYGAGTVYVSKIVVIGV